MSDLIVAHTRCLLSPAVSLRISGADAEGVSTRGLPDRIKILSWGENVGRTTGARLVVGKETLKVLSGNQKSTAHEDVELDYEHQSVKGHPNYKEDPRHAAGHGVIEVIDGDGIYLSGIDYTPNGLEHAASYKDVSGVIHTDKNDNVILVRSVALTQHGDISGMEFSDHVAALCASCAAMTPPTQHTPPTTTTKTMEDDKKSDYRALLVALLGLTPGEGNEEVTDEDISAAAEAAGTIKPASEKEDKPVSMSATPPEPSNDSESSITALNARFDKMERNRLVDKAGALGKFIPLTTEQISETPLTVLSALIDGLPAEDVPTQSTIGATQPAKRAAALSADEKNICATLGISHEDYVKNK